ncbi:hypothetical protein ACFSL6_27170 [Paenibacillus thailandensis]
MKISKRLTVYDLIKTSWVAYRVGKQMRVAIPISKAYKTARKERHAGAQA